MFRRVVKQNDTAAHLRGVGDPKFGRGEGKGFSIKGGIQYRFDIASKRATWLNKKHWAKYEQVRHVEKYNWRDGWRGVVAGQ